MLSSFRGTIELMGFVIQLQEIDSTQRLKGIPKVAVSPITTRPGSCKERKWVQSRKRRLEFLRRAHKAKGEPCRPVSRVLYPSREGRTVTIYLACPMAKSPLNSRAGRDGVTTEVERPTRGRAGHPKSPYLALLQVGFGRRCVTGDDRTLLPSDFTLVLPVLKRRCVSVPLSVPRGSPDLSRHLRRSLGVTQHPARRSPDFPPRRVGAVTQST